MLAALYRSARRYWSPRRPLPIRRPQRRLQFEALEDRALPAGTNIFAGLEFMTAGTLAVNNHVVTSSDPVQVGIAPAKGAAFTPLLQLDGGVSFTDNDPAGAFTTNGTVSGIAAGKTVQLLDAQMHTFKAPALLSSSYYSLPATDTNAADLAVGGGNLVVSALHLGATELDLQGTLNEAHLTGVTIPVMGQSHVMLNSTGVNIAGPDPTVAGPEQFTKGGVTVVLQNLDFHTDSVNGAFDITGQASVTIGGNTLNLTLGNSATPGLVFAGGDLQSLNATLTPPKGNADTPLMFHGLSLALNSATLTYDKAAGSFGIGADATLSLSDQTLNLKIGDAGMPGIVIQNGMLTTLDASLTSDFKVKGLMIHTEDLALHYDATDPAHPNVSVTGSASFTFKGQSVQLGLGQPSADGTPHPGIVIDPTTGTLASLDAAISTDITISSVTLKADDLGIHYATNDPNITITGTASFDLKDDNASSADEKDQMVSLMLGADGHPGLVINKNDGSLVGLDAAITTDLTIAGLHIKTDGLGVHYDAGQFAIYGSAEFELKGNTVMLGLGTATMPGLMLSSSGQLQSLDVSLSTHLDLLGITLDATDLTVQYVPTTDTLAITGGVSVTTKFVTFSAMLNAPGLTIVGGELETLNVTVSGGFSLFGFNVAANGLTIDYVKSANTLELSGGIMVQFTSAVQLAASISQGGLLIDTQTGALSLDTKNGLDIMGSVTFGDYGIKNLDIGFSNGPNGVNFHAKGDLYLPDNIKVSLTELDIVDGQLADIGIAVNAQIEIGDTGFFIDSLSGDLENLNNISQLKVMASVTISEGPIIQVPSIPGIFGGGMFSLVQATGSITVSASELDLSGQVSILGGLLGQGSATIALNWVTGVYTVAGNFSMYDGIISFGGSLTIDNQGDISLLANASVNVPGVIPFIGGQSLGNLNFYLQYRPGQAWDQSFVEAWTTVNLFFTSFTFGFKIDFEGNVSLIDGNDVAAIPVQADVNQQQVQDAPATVYSCNYNITDPNATSAQVTLNSLDFFLANYNTGHYTQDTVGTSGQGAAGGTTTTYYQLSQQEVILSTLSFDVLNSAGSILGHASFDAAGNFHFTPTLIGASFAPNGGTVTSTGQVDLYWQNIDPGLTTSIANVSYDTNAHYHTTGGYYYYMPNAVIEVLQNTTSGTPELVDTYTIDPMGQGTTPTSAGGALYTDTINNPVLSQRNNNWSTNYTLPHGDPDWNTLSFSVSSAGAMLGTCTVDPQTGAVHFTPSGTHSPVPIGGIVHDNVVVLDWGSNNPGNATSISAMYRSVNDRVLNIDFKKDVATDGTGIPGSYVVELVTYTPLYNSPMFTETTHYKLPIVTISPSLTNGVLSGPIDANSLVPGAAQGGPQGSATDTKISLYYTQSNSPINGTTNGTLFQTVDFGGFTNNGPNSLATGGFKWTGFKNLKAGQYYVYAVINDGQNPAQYSALSGPFTSTGPMPVLTTPDFLALTPSNSATEQGTFSAAGGTALGVSLGYTNPITVNVTVDPVSQGGTLVLPAGSMATQFPFTYPSAAAATADLDGLQFVADGTFTNATSVTITASSTIDVPVIVNGIATTQEFTYTATRTIPLLTPNTHLVVTQTQSGVVTGATVTYGGSFYYSTPTVTFTSADGLGAGATGVASILHGRVVGITITNGGIGYDVPPIVTFSGGFPLTPATATANLVVPPDPDTSIVTVTVSNPGGPDAQDGTNVMVQQYLSKGLTIESFTASQGTFDKTTQLWNIGNLPISSTNAATLTLTLKADPGTYDQPLTNMADASSDLFNYPATDAANLIAILPPSHDVVITPGTLPAGAVYSPYFVQFTADRGGGGPYTYAVTAGSLPPGAVLLNGDLNFLPTTAGTYNFSVTATSATGAAATIPVQLTIASAPLAVAGTAYSYTVGTPYFSSFGQAPGSALPAGLQISPNGVLSGTPTVPGYYSFVIREFSQFFGAYTDHPITLFVDAPISTSPGSVPAATVNSPYTQSFTATGGSGGFFFGYGGGTVPEGLQFSVDGTLQGTIAPTVAPGTYTFDLYAGDASGNYIIQPYALQVNPAIVTSPPTLPAVTVNSPYSQTITATGGTGSGYTFAITAGTLPAGLTLSPAGVLSDTIPAGTPAVDTAITLTTTDSSGTSLAQALILNVNPAIAITPTNLPDGEASVAYSAALTATGGSGTGYTFAVTGGALPGGLTLAADGSLSGTIDPATAAGYYAVTVTATDSQGASAAATCNLFVDAAMAVPTPRLPDAAVGVPYSQHVTASGGSGIYTFAVTAGALPAGLTLSPAGLLSGTIPSTTPAGTYTFMFTASDSLDNGSACSVVLTVDAANVTWTGAASTVWSNPANWSSHSVPGAGDNVTIPTHPTAGRCPVLNTAATVYNLTLQPGATLALAGHGLTVDGKVTNTGNIILQGNEAVTLAHGNDTTEGTWTYVGDGTGGPLSVADFGATDYFNVTINDSHTHHDTFATASALNVAGTLTVACGTFAPTGMVTACGVALSGTGVLDAPAVLNDSGNWSATGGTFNPDGGTVFLTGTGTTQLMSGNKAFANLTHSGSGTVNLAGTPLTVGGAFTDAAGSGNFRTNNFGVTIAGPATLTGGAFTDGAGLVHFNGGLTLNGGSFIGATGPVTAAGVTETAGSLTAPMLLTDTGDWSITGGTFNANHGTVILGGKNQYISGNTTFFNLTKTVTAADTLTFQAGTTQTIAGTLTLRGSTGKLLALRSSAPGSTWSILPGAAAVAFVDVADSVNLGKKAVRAVASHNSNDNSGWTFA
jgi:hypothetical protein